MGLRRAVDEVGKKIDKVRGSWRIKREERVGLKRDMGWIFEVKLGEVWDEMG